MAASLSPQIPKENNNLAKITQVAKKGKKKAGYADSLSIHFEYLAPTK